jgi:hypothetical protein
MIDGAYREFFVALAGASGALIGLLFVAVTITPERATQAETRVDFRARASAALLLFSNGLVLSLAALVPGTSIGWWAISLAVIVLAFAAATARLIADAVRRRRGSWHSLVIVGALVVIAGFEILAGIERIGDPHGTNGLATLDYVLIANLTVGIARAWELVGLRDTGFVASLRTLARGEDDAAD